MKQLALLLFLLGLSMFSRTQTPSLFFEKLTSQNGLSHNKVNCILQDRRGFIWLGTDDGLNRYDGKNFVKFHHLPTDSTTISGNIITDILEDKDGLLWIATADGGINRYDYRLPWQTQFRQFRHMPGDTNSIPINIINDLLEDDRGFLWLATSGKSVLRFNKKSERFEQIVPKGTKTVLALCRDRNGTIWAGRQGGGILKINPRDLSFQENETYRDLYAKLPHAAVTSFLVDKDKNIWFGSWDNVLYRYDALTSHEEVFQHSGGSSFENDEISSFAEDNLGRIFMGGKQRGLQIYDKKTNRFYSYRYDPAKEGSISDDHINCIFIDREQKVWIGTNKGLSIHNPLKQQFVQHFLDGGEYMAQMSIYDFYEDDAGRLWLGTSQGIFIQNTDGYLEHRKILYRNTPLQITSFFRDNDGTMYLGTDYSLFRYDAKQNKVYPLPNTEKDGVMNRIIDSRVVSVIKDSFAGHPVLLAAPYGHYLAYYDLSEKKWVSRLDTSLNIIQRFNLKDNLLRKFYKTKDGRTWIATAKAGLVLLEKHSLPVASYFDNRPNDKTAIANNNVYDMIEDDKGNLWVSTYGGGLHYFDTRTKEFTQIASSNTLIEGLQLDLYGNVWMISNGNLHKYDPRRKYYSSYELPDLEKTGGVKGKIFKDRKGLLYVAGTNYFISFNPDSIREKRTNPAVYLTNFWIFNNPSSHLLYEKKIKLKYRDNYFTIEFTAPDFTSNSTINYSYKLENFNHDWVDAADRNYISFSNLDGGEYVFKVRASNLPGTWNENFASVRIEIIPPYWKTAWFYILSAFFLAGTVYFFYRYRINELLKRQAIRNKIAQDLHDNVGSTLSSISVYSQVAKIYHQQDKKQDLQSTLEKISDASSEMISELNDTVWAINPRNDNMEIILQRMESLARPLLAAQNINYQFYYDKNIVAVNLDMEKRKNFYLVFKEGINNALKYSESRNLEVTIEQTGNSICMEIKDDGKGFDLAKTSEGFKSSDAFGGGNGLKNMQLRAKQMKGSLKIKTGSGQGTSLQLKFPIT